MASLLSLNQIQSFRRLSRFPDQIQQTRTCPVAIKKSSKTLSAIGCNSLKDVIAEIDDTRNSSSIVTLNFEQVLCARTTQSSRCQQEEAVLLFEAVEDLLLCDTRQWHRLKFVDTIQLHDFDYWKQHKDEMLYHLDHVAEKHDMSLRFRLVVKVPCDTNASSVISFLKALAADASIRTLMIVGGLKYSCPTDVWKDVVRVFRSNNGETKVKSSSEVEFHIFTDGSDRTAAVRGEEEKSWSNDLDKCIQALEYFERPRGRVSWSKSEVEGDVNEEVDALRSSTKSSSSRKKRRSKNKRKPSGRPSPPRSQSEVEGDVSDEVDALRSSTKSSSTRRQECSKSRRKPSSRPSSPRSQSEVEGDVSEEVDVLRSPTKSSSTKRQECSKSRRKPSSRPSSPRSLSEVKDDVNEEVDALCSSIKSSKTRRQEQAKSNRKPSTGSRPSSSGSEPVRSRTAKSA